MKHGSSHLQRALGLTKLLAVDLWQPRKSMHSPSLTEIIMPSVNVYERATASIGSLQLVGAIAGSFCLTAAIALIPAYDAAIDSPLVLIACGLFLFAGVLFLLGVAQLTATQLILSSVPHDQLRTWMLRQPPAVLWSSAGKQFIALSFVCAGCGCLVCSNAHIIRDWSGVALLGCIVIPMLVEYLFAFWVMIEGIDHYRPWARALLPHDPAGGGDSTAYESLMSGEVSEAEGKGTSSQTHSPTVPESSPPALPPLALPELLATLSLQIFHERLASEQLDSATMLETLRLRGAAALDGSLSRCGVDVIGAREKIINALWPYAELEA